MNGTGTSNGRSTRGLIGFYAACTLFGVAVTITAVSWVVFPSMDGAAVLGWVGIVVAVLASVATWYFLGVMRRER